MGLNIINITVNYKEDEGGEEHTEQERYDVREGKTPLWAKTIITAVEAIAYVFKCKPEYVILEFFDTNLQEKAYRNAQLAEAEEMEGVV